jgi:hypothetical protein
MGIGANGFDFRDRFRVPGFGFPEWVRQEGFAA